MSPAEWIALAAVAATLMLAFGAHMKSQGAQTALLTELRKRIQEQSGAIKQNTAGIAQLNVLVHQLQEGVAAIKAVCSRMSDP